MSTAIHTEGCYFPGCGGLVVFADRRGACPTCGTLQRIECVPRQVYTAGYMNRSLATLIRRANDLGAVVVDIRYEPVSKFQPWRGANLRQVLGDSYRHIPELGNVNYKNGAAGIQIANLEAGVDQVLKINGPVILLCGCSKWAECHRRDVGQAISERGHLVAELEW